MVSKSIKNSDQSDNRRSVGWNLVSLTIRNYNRSGTRDTLGTMNQYSTIPNMVFSIFRWLGAQASFNPVASILQMTEDVFCRIVIDINMLHHQLIFECGCITFCLILRAEFRHVFWAGDRKDVAYVAGLEQGNRAGSKTTIKYTLISFERMAECLILTPLAIAG